MNTLFRYIIALSVLLLIGFNQTIGRAFAEISGVELLQGSSQQEDDTAYSIHGTHSHYLSAIPENGHHLFGVETSEGGAEEDEDRSHKKFSDFGVFLKTLFVLQKAVISTDIHEEEEIFHAHEFKASSFKSLFLVLEVFRL
ncbi:hypothetical protein SAMN05216474_1187 [Lishizhenia tianjinensis]|uniref:Uncharacterized protein n=1 Tax=Lishizhenia tianjinensis TaxID=477690 RepID=A0A1I6YUV5_9FLAO|nr:hypothetical protein [Lishizhenia tianjinensis]SFT54068.1 hypothetical protein SAMN05216474_1187 [Lishizhenia tianjinensis]